MIVEQISSMDSILSQNYCIFVSYTNQKKGHAEFI